MKHYDASLKPLHTSLCQSRNPRLRTAAGKAVVASWRAKVSGIHGCERGFRVEGSGGSGLGIAPWSPDPRRLASSVTRMPPKGSKVTWHAPDARSHCSDARARPMQILDHAHIDIPCIVTPPGTKKKRRACMCMMYISRYMYESVSLCVCACLSMYIC